MLLDVLKPDFIHEDERGRLVQLAHGKIGQVNILYSEEDAMRGGHYHKEATEYYYVLGGRVDVRVEKDGVEEVYVFRTGDFFRIPPKTVHTLYFPVKCLMAAMFDVPIEKEDGTKDIWT